MRKAVKDANEPTVVEEEAFQAVMDLPTRDPFRDHEAEDGFDVEAWAEGPFLTSDEVEALSIRKGSLSAEERRKIENHVSHTYEFLQALPWTGEFRRIPEIAWTHHEKLDGSGYPNRLRAPDIPVQSRMMTIADIFDALVAWDRPYKKSVSVERALEILSQEAEAGKLDRELLRVFVEARIFDSPDFKARLRLKPRALSPPLVIAHRGDSAHRPENTLASFAGALEVGATVVELDVQLTADGHVVVLHDPTLDRTTTGRGDVRRLTLAEVRAVSAGYPERFGTRLRGGAGADARRGPRRSCAGGRGPSWRSRPSR